jgi:hypothetical protein
MLKLAQVYQQSHANCHPLWLASHSGPSKNKYYLLTENAIYMMQMHIDQQ